MRWHEIIDDQRNVSEFEKRELSMLLKRVKLDEKAEYNKYIETGDARHYLSQNILHNMS